jgi:hypothetical protein
LGWDVGRRLDGHKVDHGWTGKELLTLGKEPAGVGLALTLIEAARAVLGVARAIRRCRPRPGPSRQVRSPAPIPNAPNNTMMVEGQVQSVSTRHSPGTMAKARCHWQAAGLISGRRE